MWLTHLFLEVSDAAQQGGVGALQLADLAGETLDAGAHLAQLLQGGGRGELVAGLRVSQLVHLREGRCQCCVAEMFRIVYVWDENYLGANIF